MSDPKQTAIETLVTIAEDETLLADYRIKAACAILDRLDKIIADVNAPV